MKCKKCGSYRIHKDGTRRVWNKGKMRKVQAYRCYDCGYQWRGEK